MSINNENSLLNKNIVYDLTSFTHLDFPNHLSCIVWFVGCNMRCDYCYNKDIVFSNKGNYTLQDILVFLEQRTGLLDGVVLSGGEASSHNLKLFCQEIKSLGFKIKLDTNGTNFENIKELLECDLIDYIALDYKAPEYKFEKITHKNNFLSFSYTLDYLLKSNINFEVRTTVHNDLLNEKDINFIINDLIKRGYKNKYFLQNYLHTNENIGNITSPINKFDENLISKKIEIIYR